MIGCGEIGPGWVVVGGVGIESGKFGGALEPPKTSTETNRKTN